MRFWDSSALVTRILDEPESPRTLPILAEDPVVVIWWATPLECISAVWRAHRTARLPAPVRDQALHALGALLAPVGVVEPGALVLNHARALIARHPLRAGDALQLGAAIDWADGSPAGFDFVCLDDRLRAAAQAEGFRVLPV